MPVRIELQPTMCIRSDGFLYDLALPALQGRDVRKLGVCPRKRCGRFFVRERKDQRACSARCANALRQHKRSPIEAVEREMAEPIFMNEED
jgi:hypothetical protein